MHMDAPTVKRSTLQNRQGNGPKGVPLPVPGTGALKKAADAAQTHNSKTANAANDAMAEAKRAMGIK